MRRSAFTMIELIFVIVVIGMLSAIMIPKMDRDSLSEAAIQLASHIRYTQHLAMVDDRFDPSNSEWYKERWQIYFNKDMTYTNTKCPVETFNNIWSYTIFSENPTYTGEPNLNEMATNPENSNQKLSGGYRNTLCIDNKYNDTDKQSMAELRLGDKYSIKDIDFSSACSYYSSQRIAFDHLGRPLKGAFHNYSSAYPASNRLISSQCIITLCSVSDCTSANSDEKVEIAIEPETGYTHIL